MSHLDTLVSSGELDAKQFLEAFADGRLSPVETTSGLLQRIEDVNPIINAFVAVDEEGSLQAAAAAERKWAAWRRENPEAPRHWQQLPAWGLPISIKDTIEMAGMPTTYGSLAFKDNRKPDSPLVTQLRKAGCVLLGKTNTSEFALSMVTATRVAPPARNPYDPDRTAGGSSGGAAAATAAGLGSFGLGTDSVGSIRQPAAYCGLFGLKPTFGRISNRQSWRASPVRSHLGPLARSANDLAYSWRLLTGDNEPVSALEDCSIHDRRPLQIACLADDPDLGSVLAESIARLGTLDAVAAEVRELQPLSVPNIYAQNGDWIFAADHLAAAERLAPNFMDKHGTQLTGYAQQVYGIGDRIPAWEYRAIMADIEDFRATSQHVFDDVDLIVTSIGEDPPLLNETRDQQGFGPSFPTLSVWNLTGNPALAIPLPPAANGLPRSFQVVARRGADRLLLRLALSLQKETA